MGKPYAKISGQCEYVFDRTIVLTNAPERKKLHAEIILELLDGERRVLDTVSVLVEKQFDNPPTLLNQIEFLYAEVADAIKAKKTEYSGYVPA